MNDGKRVHHDLQYENIPFSHMSIDLHLLKAPYQKKDKGRAKITAFCYLLMLLRRHLIISLG
jgi:hypothetical protein